MKLDTVDDRHKVIEGLIKKSFKLDKMWVHDQDNTDDWGSNMEIMRNLFSIDDLIRTERILLDAFEEMENVRTRNVDEKKFIWALLTRA